jgi:hypothetical protein
MRPKFETSTKVQNQQNKTALNILKSANLILAMGACRGETYSHVTTIWARHCVLSFCPCRAQLLFPPFTRAFARGLAPTRAIKLGAFSPILLKQWRTENHFSDVAAENPECQCQIARLDAKLIFESGRRCGSAK